LFIILIRWEDFFDFSISSIALEAVQFTESNGLPLDEIRILDSPQFLIKLLEVMHAHTQRPRIVIFIDNFWGTTATAMPTTVMLTVGATARLVVHIGLATGCSTQLIHYYSLILDIEESFQFFNMTAIAFPNFI
jgi:hypothetical protein